MKIIFTGGGTGGHFYPLIAVAEAVQRVADKKKISQLQMYYFSDAPYDSEALFNNHLAYQYIPAGKLRVYFSIRNFFDLFKTFGGIIVALWRVFRVYPDVIFAKGAYSSFPTLVAARILGIPVIVHESDSAPGRVTKWAGKFAAYVALSYPECAQFFPAGKTARTGQPVRSEIESASELGAYEYFELQKDLPVIVIIGGSSGAQIINQAVLEMLPHIIEKYQIIHQTGRNNFDSVSETSRVVLDRNEYIHHYKPVAFLSPLQMRMIGGIATVIISRAGSQIFEIASWGIPSIIIPITVTNNDHQRKNAYSYARTGACSVIEEKNLTPGIVIAEIERILTDPVLTMDMKQSAKEFYVPNASQKIAEKIIEIGLSHE